MSGLQHQRHQPDRRRGVGHDQRAEQGEDERASTAWDRARPSSTCTAPRFRRRSTATLTPGTRRGRCCAGGAAETGGGDAGGSWCVGVGAGAESGGIAPGAVDYVVFYEKPLLKFDRLIETFVALDDVSHVYGGAGGTLAVDGLSIHVNRGEFAAVRSLDLSVISG